MTSPLCRSGGIEQCVVYGVQDLKSRSLDLFIHDICPLIRFTTYDI